MTEQDRRFTIPISDMAKVILPSRCRYKVIALLSAFFDESGTHNQYGDQVTLVSGFIAPVDDWLEIGRAWITAMNGRVFHYKRLTEKEVG